MEMKYSILDKDGNMLGEITQAENAPDAIQQYLKDNPNTPLPLTAEEIQERASRF
jgi:hypothetical protein